MEKYYYKSPIGNLEIICKNDALISLKIVNNLGTEIPETDFIKNIKLQLNEYFSGIRQTFDIKICPEGTFFQKLVWKELQKIPYGKTKSYTDIAELINNKNAQRAVGSACNKNRIIIIVPCHRVISKKGELGGYVYGNDIKQKLLELESKVLFRQDFHSR